MCFKVDQLCQLNMLLEINNYAAFKCKVPQTKYHQEVFLHKREKLTRNNYLNLDALIEKI